jgi:hypothetical protein
MGFQPISLSAWAESPCYVRTIISGITESSDGGKNGRIAMARGPSRDLCSTLAKQLEATMRWFLLLSILLISACDDPSDNRPPPPANPVPQPQA